MNGRTVGLMPHFISGSMTVQHAHFVCMYICVFVQLIGHSLCMRAGLFPSGEA